MCFLFFVVVFLIFKLLYLFFFRLTLFHLFKVFFFSFLINVNGKPPFNIVFFLIKCDRCDIIIASFLKLNESYGERNFSDAISCFLNEQVFLKSNKIKLSHYGRKTLKSSTLYHHSIAEAHFGYL